MTDPTVRIEVDGMLVPVPAVSIPSGMDAIAVVLDGDTSGWTVHLLATSPDGWCARRTLITTHHLPEAERTARGAAEHYQLPIWED